MSRSLFLGLFLCLAAYCSAQDLAVIKREIGMTSGALGRAIEAKDYSTLERIWAPDFVVNSPENKVLTREDVFAAIKAGELEYEKYETVVESFTVHGDVVVVMAHENVSASAGSHAGKRLVRRSTNIWQKRNQTWVMIARQATIVSHTN